VALFCGENIEIGYAGIRHVRFFGAGAGQPAEDVRALPKKGLQKSLKFFKLYPLSFVDAPIG
jgi:hypothetical protein